MWKKAERLFQNFPENQFVVNNVRVAMATADLEVSRSKVIDLLFCCLHTGAVWNILEVL